MSQTVFRYGLYSALVILGLASIHMFLLSKTLDFDTQEVIGYLTILLSMIFVFFGIRHYRDHVNNGSLTFGEGMKTGVLIVLIPAVFFGLFDLLYTEVIHPEWKNEYYSHYVEEIKRSVPADQQASKIKALEKQKEMFDSPVIEFLLMAGTVFVVGLIVTIISTLALRRNKNKPHYTN